VVKTVLSGEHGVDERYRNGIASTLATVILATLVLSVFVGSMTRPVDYREQMHGSAAVLVSGGERLYSDFCYIGMPLYPTIISALYRLTGTGHYLLLGRIASAVADAVIILAIFGIYRRVFGRYRMEGLFLGLAGVTLYVFNPFVYHYNGLMTGRDIIISCVVVSFWVYISTDFSRSSKYLRTAAMGALLSVVSMTELSAGFFQVVFFLFLLFQPVRSLRQRLGNITGFILGTAVVTAWPVWLMAQAPAAFRIDAFLLPAIERLGSHGHGAIFGKWEIMLLSLSLSGGVLVPAAAVSVGFLVLVSRRKVKLSQLRGALLCMCVAVAMIIIATTAPIMTLWEVAMVVPFIIICCSYPLFWLRDIPQTGRLPAGFRFASVLLAGCAITALLSSPGPVRRIGVLFEPARWVPLRFHAVAEDVRRRCKPPMQVLTIQPLYALEAGATIYPELSAGAPAFSRAGILTQAERETAKLIDRRQIGALAEQHPPSAILFDKQYPAVMDRYTMAMIIQRDLQMNNYDRKKWEKVRYEQRVMVYYRR